MTIPTNPLVQLHYTSLELLNDKSFTTQVFGWLSSAERKRYKRFVSKQQANQFLLARALVRSQLSKQVPGVLPHEWVFVVDDSGKPRLAGGFSHFNFHFNLSHSEDLVVLALGEGLSEELGEGLNLGVDVECIHRPVFSMALAKRYFAKTELADLMRLTEQQQVKRIAQLWTLKESLLKASGLGIRVSLAKLAFCYQDESELEVNLSPDLSQIFSSQNGGFISLFSLGSDYSLALTIQTAEADCTPKITSHEWVGMTNQSSGLSCELQRKTAGQNFS